MKINHDRKLATKIYFKIIFVLLLLLIPGLVLAQEFYYFHTVHSHGLSLAGGRTAKINYTYQASHLRQLKFSGLFIYDSYVQANNRIKSNIFNINFQMQYHLINSDRFFLNGAVGGGGYYLGAKDLLNIKHKEWRVNLAGGLQAEFYLVRNTMALTLDYDLLYMPLSKLYEFMHIPTLGLTFYLF